MASTTARFFVSSDKARFFRQNRSGIGAAPACPMFDPLRNDPRFEKLASSAPK
jgi:hypothetical protein